VTAAKDLLRALWGWTGKSLRRIGMLYLNKKELVEGMVAGLVVAVLIVLSILLGFCVGQEKGHKEGYKEGKKEALNVSLDNHELEMACLGMWVSEQNHEAVKRGLVK
jgi:Mg2+/citrate symporter